MRHVHLPYTVTRVSLTYNTHLTASQLQCAFQDGQIPIEHHAQIETVTITERTVMRLTAKPEKV